MDKKINNNTPLIYQGKNGEILLKEDRENDTIWANRMEMSSMFGVNPQAISKHIKNIYLEGELDKNSTSSKMELVQNESGRRVKRQVNYYNLDMIISVGYRINSITGTKFRKRATGVLKDHITKGFSINKDQIQRNYDNFLKAVEEIKAISKGKDIGNDEVINLISSFAKTWLNLESFDTGILPQNGMTRNQFEIQSEKLYKDVFTLKQDLIKKGLATEMFAQEKKTGNLEGIFGNIFASFDGKDLYETIEEKAANLLYLVIKNHPFNDGNKRTGAFCFVWFLQTTGFDFRENITPESLTTLTLLIAQSDPKDKERMIGLILLLLKN